MLEYVKEKNKLVPTIVEYYMRISHSHREIEFGELKLDKTQDPPEYVCIVSDLIHIASVAAVKPGWQTASQPGKKGSIKVKPQSSSLMDTRFAFTLELHQDKTPGIGIVTGLASRGHVQLAARDPQTYDMWQDGLRALLGGADTMASKESREEINQLIAIEIECDSILKNIANACAAPVPPPPDDFSFVQPLAS